MADIIAFRTSTPVIHIDGSGNNYFVNVRPCPPSMPSLRHFKSGDEAFKRATQLQQQHGWRIEVACDCGLGDAG